MSELRVALLIISAGFLAGLTWWEWRRPRQAHAGSTARRPPREAEIPPPAPARSAVESPLVLPEIRAREPFARHDLPVVELGLDAPAATIPAAAAADVPRAEDESPHAAPPAPPAVPEPGGEPHADRQFNEDDERDDDGDFDEDARLAADSEAAPAPGAVTAAAPGAREELPRLPTAASPLVEWPPDAERRIVSLRLVATSPERFVGRSLRQALSAEGFVLGRFAIFHKPDEAQRAVLSAASLTRPGTFDADTMDSQHFGGLSLFAVLPAPRPAAQAFEELVNTARIST